MTAYRFTSPTSPVYTAPPSRWRQAALKLGVKVADRFAAAGFLFAALEFAHAAGWQP